MPAFPSNPQNHYENFPVASRLCPRAIRPAVAAIYNFARAADDLADEGEHSATERLQALQAYRAALQTACKAADVLPNMAWFSVMQPLQRAIRQHQLPVDALHDLITAFERDVRNTASAYVYPNWDDLADYARYSANPVGRLMLHLYGVRDATALIHSDAICTALQFYNFWQDISVDIKRQRFYLPADICASLGVDPRQPATAVIEQRTELVHSLLDYTDALMRSGSALPKLVAKRSNWLAGLELSIVMQGGMRIGKKTRNLGARIVFERPTIHGLDLLRIFSQGLTGLFAVSESHTPPT